MKKIKRFTLHGMAASMVLRHGYSVKTHDYILITKRAPLDNKKQHYDHHKASTYQVFEVPKEDNKVHLTGRAAMPNNVLP